MQNIPFHPRHLNILPKQQKQFSILLKLKLCSLPFPLLLRASLPDLLSESPSEGSYTGLPNQCAASGGIRYDTCCGSSHFHAQRSDDTILRNFKAPYPEVSGNKKVMLFTFPWSKIQIPHVGLSCDKAHLLPVGRVLSIPRRAVQPNGGFAPSPQSHT